MPLSNAPEHRILYLLLAVLLSLSFFTAFGDRGFIHLWRLWQEKKNLDQENFLLQSENERLRERVRLLRHNDRYLEKVAREELGFARPGEIIYRFVPAQPNGQNPGPEEQRPDRAAD
jgi:cell division protein FtsB